MQRPALLIMALTAALLAACSTVDSGRSQIEDQGIEESETTSTAVEAAAGHSENDSVESASPKKGRPAINPIGEVDLAQVPDLDTSTHNVPLEAIIFDTFRTNERAVALPRAAPALIRSLRDAIPPLYAPSFVSSAESDRWLGDEDIVLGYANGEEAYAYPLKILNNHEMASHSVNGKHILASLCPLCRSWIVYDRTLEGQTVPLLFGNTSALYESDMVMFDHQTGSYWNQVSGEAIAGPLTGERLTILPAQMTTWGRWKALCPDTLALSEDTGFGRPYRKDPFAGYGERLNSGGRFAFPVSEAALDIRLDPGAVVLGLEINGESRAYPLEALGSGVFRDRLGGSEIVLFTHEERASGAAFLPEIDGRSLTFFFRDGAIMDEETGSSWNLAGEALEGELDGQRLEQLPARSSFWFSLVANNPGIEIFEAP